LLSDQLSKPLSNKPGHEQNPQMTTIDYVRTENWERNVWGVLNANIVARLKNDFFFEHGDTHAADQFGDEVEHHGANHPQRRAEQGCQQAKRGEVTEQRRAVE